MVVTYTRIEVEVVSPAAAVAAPCEDLHLSQNMNHMFSLESDRKLDSPYPRGKLSDRKCNIKLLAS